jgi:hypothetical protein
MDYQVHPGAALTFSTHPRSRRGRGVLFATAPWVVYVLAISGLFALSTQDLSLWSEVKQFAAYGAGVTAALAAICFGLGRRIRDRIELSEHALTVIHTPALGSTRTSRIAFADLSAFAIDPSLRSLGADVLWVAVHRDGRRLPIAEGEPHSAQVRELAAQAAAIAGLPLESPRFTA